MMDPGQEDELEETEKINVVPLADLTLVLLIILMVLTPMIIQSSIKVSSPELGGGSGPGAAAEAAPPDPLLIEVLESGYRLNSKPVADLEVALTAVRDRLEENPERPVIVSAPDSIKVKRIVKVLDGARLAGARDISLLKQPEAGRRNR